MALAQLKFWWGILETLEKAARSNSTLCDRYAFFNFTMQQWVREQLIRLSEVDFAHTPARVQRAVQLKWGIYKSTLPCEQLSTIDIQPLKHTAHNCPFNFGYTQVMFIPVRKYIPVFYKNFTNNLIWNEHSALHHYSIASAT